METIEQIKTDFIELIKLYQQSSISTKKAELFICLHFLNELYYTITGKDYEALDQLEKENLYIAKKAVELSRQKQKRFIQDFLDKKNFHQALLKKVLKSDFYGHVVLKNQEKYSFSPQARDEILRFFLEQKFPQGIDFLKQLEKENRVLEFVDLNSKIYQVQAMIYPVFPLNQNYLLCPAEKKNTVSYLIDVVHELGHIEDFDLESNKGLSKQMNYFFALFMGK